MLWRDPVIRTAVCLYATVGFMGITTAEVFPLYVLNDAVHGGFGWKTDRIGLLATIAGPALILYQGFVYTPLVAKVGMIQLTRIALGIHVCCLLLTPTASVLVVNSSFTLQSTYMGILFILLTVTRVSIFTSIFVWVSNAALPRDRGRVNGIGQAVVSLGRCIGPPIGTTLFAATVSTLYASGVLIPWYFLAGIGLLALRLTYALPPWINRTREEYDTL